jgi:EAL domain-containing protein (putative c-di-GMP-specific phosphodiesterase class I)
MIQHTKTNLMSAPERAARTNAALRAFGIALAIDDFGSGYSSLSYLHRLSISGVKIDKSFVQALRSDQSGRAIVQATIDLGHALGFTVVAEGVEDLTTLNELRRLGCDSAQGYHFAHPMPPIAVGDWLRSSVSV